MIFETVPFSIIPLITKTKKYFNNTHKAKIYSLFYY